MDILKGISICSFAVTIAALVLVVYAFMDIFKHAKSSENDVQVVQRQLRGFALLLVANMVLVIGGVVCAGSGIYQLRDLNLKF